MRALLAAVPILLVLVLMIGRRWPASRAGIVAVVVALGLGIGVFGLGDGRPAGIGLPAALAGTGAEAAFTSATILWIILPALAIHHLQMTTGATEVLREALGRLSADPRILALLIGWFFALFAEGAAGFGASVALAAPFLVGVGYAPLHAVTVAMIGHAVGVSFGAIGTPIVPQAAATGLDPGAIAAATADYHVLVGWVPLVIMVLVASRGTGQRATGAIWGWTALAAVAFLVPAWLLARFVGPELPTLGGSLVGAAIFVVALRVAARRSSATTSPSGAGQGTHTTSLTEATPPFERTATPRAVEVAGPDATHTDGPDGPGGPGGSMLRAGAPYLVLVTLVVLTRTVPVVRDTLDAVVVDWTLPGGFTGSFRPLTHPGTLLVIAFAGGALWQRVTSAQLRRAIGTTVRQLGAVTIALVAMLLLARTMVHAGMTQELATAAAGGAGSAWPLLAPFVGMLGTFVTGSATASNVLFTDLQVATAETLDLPVLPLLGAQGFGAAVGNIVCPHNIVAAGATVGLTGAEGDVLRRTIGVALLYALLGGLLALIFV